MVSTKEIYVDLNTMEEIVVPRSPKDIEVDLKIRLNTLHERMARRRHRQVVMYNDYSGLHLSARVGWEEKKDMEEYYEIQKKLEDII